MQQQKIETTVKNSIPFECTAFNIEKVFIQKKQDLIDHYKERDFLLRKEGRSFEFNIGTVLQSLQESTSESIVVASLKCDAKLYIVFLTEDCMNLIGFIGPMS